MYVCVNNQIGTSQNRNQEKLVQYDITHPIYITTSS